MPISTHSLPSPPRRRPPPLSSAMSDSTSEPPADAARSSDSPLPELSDESSFVSRLLDSEPRHLPRPDYISLCRNRARLCTSRQDSISYILEAHAHFGFKPVTVLLSINYLDRFLSAHAIPESGWAFRLLLVACLSLAAKMEESSVPLLSELQLLSPAYVFEAKTLQRMELLVIDKLEWNLRSVTPFDYLGYFISLLPSPAPESDSGTIYALASSLILKTTRAIYFLGFPPSVIAAAAVSIAGGEDVRLPDAFDARISREMVRSCHHLIDEYLLDTCPSNVLGIEPLSPPSPSGVLDAVGCASCDSQPENLRSGSDGPENTPPDVQES